MVSALPTQLSQSRQTNQIIWSHTVIIVTLSKERTLAILQLFQPQNIQQDSKLLTSDSKKPGQAKVVVQYCSLSRFFWIRCYALNLTGLIKVSKVSWTSQLSYEILRSSLEKRFDKTNFILSKETGPKRKWKTQRKSGENGWWPPTGKYGIQKWCPECAWIKQMYLGTTTRIGMEQQMAQGN